MIAIGHDRTDIIANARKEAATREKKSRGCKKKKFFGHKQIII
jgi:hypothetical protein